jgi:hypothetical protein
VEFRWEIKRTKVDLWGLDGVSRTPREGTNPMWGHLGRGVLDSCGAQVGNQTFLPPLGVSGEKLPLPVQGADRTVDVAANCSGECLFEMKQLSFKPSVSS